MVWINFALDLLANESRHFWLAWLAGLLAYLLTWIIFCAPYWALHRLRGIPARLAVAYFTLFLSLLLGVSLALMSHAWLDGYAIWYTTPLGPSLDLTLPTPVSIQ